MFSYFRKTSRKNKHMFWKKTARKKFCLCNRGPVIEIIEQFRWSHALQFTRASFGRLLRVVIITGLYGHPTIWQRPVFTGCLLCFHLCLTYDITLNYRICVWNWCTVIVAAQPWNYVTKCWLQLAHHSLQNYRGIEKCFYVLHTNIWL